MERVYNMERNLELCKRRLKVDPDIPFEVKQAILDFSDDLSIQGRSIHRQYFYIERLKIVGRIMGSSFLSPNRRDVKDAILKLQNFKAKRVNKYSDRTISDIKMSLKKFYKDFGGGKYFNAVEWLKMNNHASKEKKPEDVVSVKEINQLLTACINERDRAIISLLYDSGCRIGEVLTLKVKDVLFDAYGMKLIVNGKTGVRRVRVVGDSVSILRDYIDKFDRSDPNSSLFVKIGKEESMVYADVNTMFYKVSKRAGIKRRIHPHLFRHTRATLLARDLKEAPLEATMGWVHGSRMSRTYVHLSDEDIDDAVLKVYGIEKDNVKQKVEYRPKLCGRCHTENPTVNEYCLKCGLPLDANKLIELEMKEKEVEETLLKSNIVSQTSKDLLQAFDPQFKDKMLEALLQQIIENPELKERFREELQKQ